jgi:tetraprenyl-beta-curcumene synthase
MSRRTLLLVAILARYWLTIWPLARRELRGWRKRAEAIPDPDLRRLALLTHREEHMNAEGAAIFATLAPWRRTPTLVRTLVAYQVLFDYLDTITEGPKPSQADARQLHRALTDALEPVGAVADWYALHPVDDDGGYVAALVDACRAGARNLPAFQRISDNAQGAAVRSGEVQALNHDPRDRARSLAAWAAVHADLAGELLWWEFAASASSSLAVHALLGMASSHAATGVQVNSAERAYCVMLGALNTLLESLVDLPKDARSGDHSFAAYYASADHATTRIAMIATDAQRLAHALPRGDRHALILAGMASFYLSAPEAWLPYAGLAAERTLLALGWPTPALVRLLRMRRALQLAQPEPAAQDGARAHQGRACRR